MFRFLIAVLVSFCLSLVHANLPDKRFINITTEQGLSSSWVRCVYQDDLGFIWFCTNDGLNRFDGYSIKEFKPDENDSTSIISGAVTFMHPRKDGKYWICTERGVSIFDSKKETFTEFTYLKDIRVTGAMDTRDGKVWFSTYSGAFCYNQPDSTIIQFLHSENDSTSISNSHIEFIYEDSYRNLWLSTQNGLNLFSPEEQNFRSHYPAHGKSSLSGNWVKCIIEDDQNRLWLGIEEYGLLIFENFKERPTEGKFILVLENNTNAIAIDGSNNMWIGNSNGSGIEIFDLNKFQVGHKPEIQQYTSSITIPGSLVGNSITYIMEDRDAGIWISGFSGGISYYSPLMNKFEAYRMQQEDRNSISNNVINVFFEDEKYFWVGTEDGLNRIDIASGENKIYFHEPSNQHSLGANSILSMLKDTEGRLWIGTWMGGLQQYDYKNDNFIVYKHDPENPYSISSNNVFKIFEDSKANIWIGTNGGGLNLFNPSDNSFRHFLPQAGNDSSIYHNAINDICEIADGKLLISVYHSLELFDPERGNFQHHIYSADDSLSLGAGNIQDIFIDSKDNIWLATSAGLHLFNLFDRNFIRYLTTDGLPSNTIQAILEDSTGNLWLSTNNGISKFENAVNYPHGNSFINFGVADGMSSREFVRRSAIQKSDGWFYFGSSKGYTRFRPESIKMNTIKSSIVLTRFNLLGGDDEPNNKNLFKSGQIHVAEEIILAYHQSDFEIEFATLSYFNSRQNIYEYMLEGYELEWHEIGNKRVATYTNIHPGKYVFRVRSSNSDQDRTLSIILLPPWWQTLFAKILLLLSLLSIAYLIFHLRFKMFESQRKLLKNSVEERTRELTKMNSAMEATQKEISLQNVELTNHRFHLEQLVEERTEKMKNALQQAEEADELKSAFLANMSHEIRTPMNAIVGFANLLSDGETTEQEKSEFAVIINNNVESLMVLINDILEISLIEANQISLKNNPVNVTHVLKELESTFQIKNDKEIVWNFVNKNEEDLILVTDQTRFRQIFTNLLNNANKYTDKGSIRFGYEVVDRQIQFFVADSGIGIAEDQYDNIFKYFHKIDKGQNKLYRGAGIGLSISNKLVELMKGKIWVESEVGVGSAFYFTLPDSGTYKAAVQENEKKSLSVHLLKGKTILVAEDESNNYLLIERILKSTQATLVWAKNGKEAVNKVTELKNMSECLVLMDIKMPVLNGINAAAKIKEIDSSIPIIAVTAYAHANDRHEIMKHNFVDYLAKPIKAAQLIDVILKNIRQP